MEALCPTCNNLKELIACYHCKQPLCASCVSGHITQWRELSIKYCEKTSQDFEKYLKKINSISPIIFKNHENIQDIKAKIEENFQRFLKNLIKQKEDLFEQIDSTHKENENFLKFESEILNLSKSLQSYEDIIQNNNLENLPIFLSEFQNFQEKVALVSTDYSTLRSQPLKIIGEYEEPGHIDLNFFGNLIITESDPLPQKETKHKKSIKLNDSLQKCENSKVPMFGTLRIKLKRLVEQSDLNLIQKKPIEEHEVPIKPVFIKSNSKNIFICDQIGNLVVLELSKTLLIKSSINFKVENIRDMAVNKNFIALSFANLNEDQMKKMSLIYKNFNYKSGILIFKIADFSLDKIISSSKNYNLSNPCGIAMNESSIFVCEKDSQSLYKIDLKKGSLTNQLVAEGEPTGVDIGEKHLVYVDSQSMEINLADPDKLTKVKSLKIPQDFYNQLYDLVIRDKIYIAVKNKDDIRCVVYDTKLNIKHSFDYEKSNSHGIGSFQSNGNNFLLLGKYENNKFRIGFFNEN